MNDYPKNPNQQEDSSFRVEQDNQEKSTTDPEKNDANSPEAQELNKEKLKGKEIMQRFIDIIEQETGVKLEPYHYSQTQINFAAHYEDRDTDREVHLRVGDQETTAMGVYIIVRPGSGQKPLSYYKILRGLPEIHNDQAGLKIRTAAEQSIGKTIEYGYRGSAEANKALYQAFVEHDLNTPITIPSEIFTEVQEQARQAGELIRSMNLAELKNKVQADMDKINTSWSNDPGAARERYTMTFDERIEIVNQVMNAS